MEMRDLDQSFMSKEDAGVEKLKNRLLNMAIETISHTQASAARPQRSAQVSIREAEELLHDEYGIRAGELIIENDRLKTTIQRMGLQMSQNPTDASEVIDRLRTENENLSREHERQLAEQRSAQEMEYDLLREKHSRMMERQREEIERMRSEEERRR